MNRISMLGALACAALFTAAPALASASAPANRGVLSAPSKSVAIDAGYGSIVTIVGRGNGHGDGLSQWGAYGYSTVYNWDWHQILAHDYGGTTEAAADPAAALGVRLRALDDADFTAVVDQTANLVVNTGPATTKYRTVVAIKTGASSYKVYGRGDLAVCPATATTALFDAAGSGWTVLSPTSTSLAGSATVLEVSAAGVDPATANRADLAGVCQPSDDSVKLYRGSIQIVATSAGEARTVNKVPVEQYLRGVVPRESPAGWADAGGGKGANALRAQAVAARTYGLVEARYPYAKTCDTDACQVYGGAARRATATDTLQVLEDSRADAAVAATAGVVLHTPAGGLAFTQFNSSSGGITSGANFPSVDDLGDAVPQNPFNRWTTTVLRTDIEAQWPAVGSLLAVDITKRNGLGEWGGRVQSLILRGSKSNVTLTGDQFRIGLGLHSNWFEIPSGCDGPPSLAPLPAATATTFHGIVPTRLVDTRIGLGASTAPVASGCVIPLKVSSLYNLPDAARAVSLSLTVVNPSGAGFIAAYPCDGGRPVVSNVNYGSGQTVANQATVALDAEGQVCIYAHQRTDVLVDLLGWFGGSDGAHLKPLTPARIADTRDGTGGTHGPVPADGVVTVNVFAAGGVPAGSKPTAVVLNLTSTEAAGDGYFTAYPCDQARPTTSNLNTVAGRDVAAHVVVPVSAAGTVCVFTHVAGQVIADISGWYGTASGAASAGAVSAGPATSGRYTPVAPSRLIDTRDSAIVGDGAVLRVPVAGHGGVPAANAASGQAANAANGSASGVTVNVTATGSASPGHVTVYACDQPLPNASAVNFLAGADVANLVTVPLGATGELCVFTNRTTHIIVDAAGWYS